MKLFTLFTSLLVSTQLLAAEPYKAYSIPEIGDGFISVEKFNSLDQAVAFCEAHQGEMIGGENMAQLVMVIAMSAMIIEDEFLFEALTFSLEAGEDSESGAWFWVLEENKVVLWYDGQGFTMEAFTVAELEKQFPGNVIALPAICQAIEPQP